MKNLKHIAAMILAAAICFSLLCPLALADEKAAPTVTLNKTSATLPAMCCSSQRRSATDKPFSGKV